MSTELTPYDTGDRCEAKPWIPYGTEISEVFPAENFGKVDFDDEEDHTVCTVYVQRDEDGRHSVRVESMLEDDALRVVVDQSVCIDASRTPLQELLQIIESYRHALRAQHVVDEDVIGDYDRAYEIARALVEGMDLSR